MYLQKFPKIFRPMISYFFDKQAKKYIEFLDKIDQIFTNSQNTHDRLLYFCGKNSEILYPPTDTTRFSPADAKNPLPNLPENYYLSFSRLSPPKRVGLVVDAFLQMPDKNLVFTYGKNDPLKEEILEKCQHAKNIFPIPAPNDDDFIRLVQNAIANIYIPIDEDFGMSPVESMACGVPVIGVNE
jgi:glycosyltransferase, family 1